ncbi:hypothetical protein CYMTET_43673 [Cymbomonas tetramitiformis]|uniref:Small multidrug resistance protein n=1 Tax=Cymbomonas tetramitiformis TaxID=36881 RepID=A0AAE0F0E2_9CHLO|nr:hypothetical protein CYMTET_45336 [Cymbomonas tetramitiformis]KAK3246802.1 hypothetical protein CYMTET_43673 [Cymbomonas tetramitiformis]
MRHHMRDGELHLNALWKSEDALAFQRGALTLSDIGVVSNSVNSNVTVSVNPPPPPPPPVGAPIQKPNAQAWALLGLTIVLEVIGSTMMKLSNGFTNFVPSVIVIVAYVSCVVALTYSLKYFELSTAYAIWSGVGTFLTAAVGIALFHESVSFMKIASIGLIILGVVGLNLTGH